MTMLAPYRTAAIVEPDTQQTKREQRAARLWKRYRRACVQHTVALVAWMIGLIALLIASPIHVYPMLAGFPILFWFTWFRVRVCACPFCGRKLVDGPKEDSYAPMLLGAFPQACTHCGTEIGKTKPSRA